jgi:hypothetical protein
MRSEIHLEKILLQNEIVRNKDGIAVLYTYDNSENINGEFLVEDEDWKIFIHFSWHLGNEKYAVKMESGTSQALHLLVYEKHFGRLPENCTVDHINRNTYDCRKINLRAATPSQQIQNQNRKRKGFLRYKGVFIKNGKFFTKCKKEIKGPYNTEEEAALTYNEIAIKLFGADAKTNKIITKNTTLLDSIS